jgi:hypothetical protein
LASAAVARTRKDAPITAREMPGSGAAEELDPVGALDEAGEDGGLDASFAEAAAKELEPTADLPARDEKSSRTAAA